jgi:predicted metalloprotease with PDZ domain
MFRKILVFTLFTFVAMSVQAAIKAQYTLSFPEPQTHYIEVSLKLQGVGKKAIDLKMPVWTPGSYLVREFSRNVESLTCNGTVKKLSKNTWQVTANATGDLEVSYKVYAYELSVRTSYVDVDMAVLNAASIFCRIDSKDKVEYDITLSPFSAWGKINTSLNPIGNDIWKRHASDFDELVDAPILLGNQAVHTFDVNGIPHRVAMAGKADYDANKLVADMQKVCMAATSIVGEHPCKDYTFLVVNASSGSGGLEHANSCLLHTGRGVYTNDGQYKNFLSLVAHEYFHLWNVKRIRPIELGPFDYDHENYTNLLWVSEGFTSYYDDYICQKAGVISIERFMEICASNINTVENTPGSLVQPLCEASSDAWIKYYRPNENSANATSNYYTKGAMIALLLDAEIIAASKGEKNLDNLMHNLYQTYYKNKNRGFTEKEFMAECEKLVGRSLTTFFADFTNGTKALDYNESLSKIGLHVLNLNEGKADLGLGVGLNTSAGKMVVSSVLRNSSAWKYGLNVNDEIMAIDGYRVGVDISAFINTKNAGDTLKILISRDGLIKELSIVLEPYQTFAAKLEKVAQPNEMQLKCLKKWAGN